MKKLDESKAYDLRGLSDEQLKEFLNWLQKEEPNSCWSYFFEETKFIYYDESFIETETIQDLEQYYNEVVNAITLFDTNERIIQLQQEEQKLNNRLMEIADEMRELTYKD